MERHCGSALVKYGGNVSRPMIRIPIIQANGVEVPLDAVVKDIGDGVFVVLGL